MKDKFPVSSFQFPIEEGQTLVEVIVALAVAVLVIVALVRVTVTSIHNASFAKNRALATRYAQKWMEEARKLRDEQTEDAFFVNGSCNAGPETVDTIFTRTRTCSDLSVVDGKKTITVVVTVGWTDAAGPHESRLETRLTNWK